MTTSAGIASSRILQASCHPTALFGNAIASSESYVSFTAGGTVDSWDSDPVDSPATPAVPYAFTPGNAANYHAVVAASGNGTYGVILFAGKRAGIRCDKGPSCELFRVGDAPSTGQGTIDALGS